MRYLNKYTVATAFAVFFALIYLYLHYNRHCDIEVGNSRYVVAGTVFTVILYALLFVEVASLDTADLGRLKDDPVLRL